MNKTNGKRVSKVARLATVKRNASKKDNFEMTGDAMLSNADCETALPTIQEGSVDLLLTDPPYNLGLFMKSRGTNMGKLRENHFAASGWDQLEVDMWTQKMDSFFAQAARVMKIRGSMIVFMSLIKAQTIIELATKHGFYYKTTGIWHKTNPAPKITIAPATPKSFLINSRTIPPKRPPPRCNSEGRISEPAGTIK